MSNESDLTMKFDTMVALMEHITQGYKELEAHREALRRIRLSLDGQLGATACAIDNILKEVGV